MPDTGSARRFVRVSRPVGWFGRSASLGVRKFIRINFLTPREADRPNQPTGRETLTKRRAEPVSGIRQHAAEPNTGCDHAINLSQCNLWLGPCRAMFDWNARTLQTHRIVRPTLGNEET